MRRGREWLQSDVRRCGATAPTGHAKAGDNMTDTIKLLVAIGSDASLRYASPDDLKCVLDQAKASVELKMAVATGDSAPLRVELCIQWAQQTPQTHAPGRGDDEEEEADVPLPEPPQPDRSTPPPVKRDSLR